MSCGDRTVMGAKESLKDHAKAQVAEADDKAYGDVATPLYYGCVASALVQSVRPTDFQPLVSGAYPRLFGTASEGLDASSVGPTFEKGPGDL